jgi:cytochrome c-type biogenesis protein CcmH/NrfG
MRLCCSWARVPTFQRCRRGIGRSLDSVCLLAFSCLAVVVSAEGQEVGSEGKEMFGSGSVISVKVHAGSTGESPSSAEVRLLLGSVPAAQRNTSSGVAEFVVNQLGEYTVIVTAPGFTEQQKDVSVQITGRTQVDIYLRAAMTTNGGAPLPGLPVLAPKAKEALDQGILALKENRVSDAEKRLGEAMRLAPGNPDVLYVQGVLRLKQRNWQDAQAVLEKATQIDPSSARAFAALGMALCNAGKYDAAVPPLEKSLQLDPGGTWQARWALAKAYYRGERYDDALTLSQAALTESHGEEPEIALLVAQSQTAVGRYEDAAQTLRAFLRDHADLPEAATARRWLDQLAANGKIHAN